MTQERKATLVETIRGYVYTYAWLIVLLVSIGIALVIHKLGLMETIIENATTLA